MSGKQALLSDAFSLVSKGLTAVRKQVMPVAGTPQPETAVSAAILPGDVLNAALLDQVDELENLLARGADRDERSETGATPMIYAAVKGHIAIVQTLINSGANINAMTDDGDTALNWASASGHTEIVQLLLEHGAEADKQDKQGHTALMFAAHNGSADIVTILADQGVNLEASDAQGYSAQNHAYDQGKGETAQALDTALEERKRIAAEKARQAAEAAAELLRITERVRKDLVSGKQDQLRGLAARTGLKPGK